MTPALASDWLLQVALLLLLVGQQMTSGLVPAKPRPQDPYSKVVLTEGNNLGLSSYTFEYNIPGTQGAGAGGEFGLQQYNQSPYSETQSPYSNMSQPSPDSSGLANLNIAGSSPMAQPPNVSDSDIVNILGLQDTPTHSDNLSDTAPAQADRRKMTLRLAADPAADGAPAVLHHHAEEFDLSFLSNNVSVIMIRNAVLRGRGQDELPRRGVALRHLRQGGQEQAQRAGPRGDPRRQHPHLLLLHLRQVVQDQELAACPQVHP